MTKEEIYSYRIEKGWIGFPRVKEAILAAMEDYAKEYHKEQVKKISLNLPVSRSSPAFSCECELKLDRCTMMCEYMIKKTEGR